jgi:Na+/H+-dicarboxylate symporter
MKFFKIVWTFWQKREFWQKVTIGLLLGIIVGILFGKEAAVLSPIGDLFMKLIKMIIVPLIFVSVVVGITGIKDSSSLSRLSIKSVIAFLATSSIAIIIGLIVALIIKPGIGVDLQALGLNDISNALPTPGSTMAEILFDAIPGNALNALVSGHLLQVVFFSFFTGITINGLSQEDKRVVIKGFNVLANIIFKMIHIVLKFAPYGSFAITASIVGSQGLGTLQNLGMLAFSLVIAMIIQYLIFGLMIWFFAKISPMPFYKKSLEYQSLAFSTSSSKATLPTTMDVCMRKLGISKNSTSFVLPLGSSINMDGTAIYAGICALFFAQAYGVPLTAVDYVLIIITATLGSIGAAGIPSGTLVILPMVLSAINVPIGGIAFIAGIDRILDMMRTTLNITGDAAVTLIIDASEKTLDKKIYNTDSAQLVTEEDF